MPKFCVLCFILVLSVVASTSISAQNPQNTPQNTPQTREITGMVLSESSQPIADAEVLLLDSTGTVIRTTTTTEAGGFTLALTVGQSYIIQVRKLGLQLYWWESGRVEAGKPISMPFLMQRVAPLLDTVQLKKKMTKEQLRTFLSLLGVLDDIRAGDVQEIRYANCWDRTVPIELRDAMFVTLKPGAKLR